MSKSKPGRPKGTKLPYSITMWDRWYLSFYTVIKEEREVEVKSTGMKEKRMVVIDRDYSKNLDILRKKAKWRLNRSRGDKYLMIQAIKKAKYKEDVFKVRTDLLLHDDEPPDSKYQCRAMRKESLERLEKAVIALQQYLIDNGLNEVAAGLIKKWGELEYFPMPRDLMSKAQRELEQLQDFKW